MIEKSTPTEPESINIIYILKLDFISSDFFLLC